MQAFGLSAQGAGADGSLWSRAAWSTEPGLPIGTVSQKVNNNNNKPCQGMNWKYSNVKHQPLLEIARASMVKNFNFSSWEVGGIYEFKASMVHISYLVYREILSQTGGGQTYRRDGGRCLFKEGKWPKVQEQVRVRCIANEQNRNTLSVSVVSCQLKSFTS